ncbi:RidA family protein [Mycolicibacterium neoaurum]|uniref:RidA family protein n=1 Tax=Mycolicibacterium neoaurum TaxID=1795 RepID=UPI0026729159|nr:RidA family protein [Mycolicibacterium neoaurum]MDO3400405.1 RidA family protein [Mycolicibacterium neoaurum]
MTTVNPAAIAPPMGAFSHVAILPHTSTAAYISGQIGAGVKGELVSENCYEQTLQAFANIEAILSHLDVDPSALVKLLTLVVGTDGFTEFARARDEVFRRWYPTRRYPAHSAATVSELAAPGLKVEIEAVVALPR